MGIRSMSLRFFFMALITAGMAMCATADPPSTEDSTAERPREQVLGDFESESLAPWEFISGDMGAQPVRAPLRDIRWDQSGDGFIATGEVDRSSPGHLYKLGHMWNDTLIGVLRSPSFEIDLPYITFLIGGGYNPTDLRLTLVRDSDGEMLRTATGFENDIMHRRIWDVSEFEGETCHLEIVDNSRSTRWGRINVDDIRMVNEAALHDVMPPVMAGDFEVVYNPGVGEERPWYINDHCVIRGPDGLWHMFGITHFEPPNPLDEDHLAHATARDLWQVPWDKHPFALDYAEEPWGETHLWAPHVVEHDGLYYMFYCAGDEDHTRYKIHLATSDDLWNWERHPENPMVVDGYDARDPFVTRVGDQWVMYYTATSEPAMGNHIVAAVTSDDLIHWDERETVFTDPSQGSWGGPTESPVVVQRGDQWYLFIGPRNGYDGTDVFVSDDPFHWEPDQRVSHIPSHAAEVILDLNGDWVVSRAGWRRGGLHLAPLLWNDGLDDAETNFN